MTERRFDVVVVGAGFAGLYMLHRLRELGLSVRVFEAGSGVGGTWYWNRYPGARCDVESMEYSYSFSTGAASRSGSGASATPAQPEILRYLNHVADRFDLRRDIQFETRVTRGDASTRPRPLDGRDRRRRRRHGAVRRHGDRLPVGAPTCRRSRARARSRATVYHTGAGPHEGVDFTGKRVGVIGTGSSGDPGRSR